MTDAKMPVHLKELREWFLLNDHSWRADKTDEQLLNETRLDCYSSGVTELPYAIGCMRKPEWLNLNFNLVEYQPESIGELSRLESLQLSETKLTRLPQSIGKLKCLSSLRIDNSGLPALPESISDIQTAGA